MDPGRGMTRRKASMLIFLLESTLQSDTCVGIQTAKASRVLSPIQQSFTTQSSTPAAPLIKKFSTHLLFA